MTIFGLIIYQWLMKDCNDYRGFNSLCVKFDMDGFHLSVLLGHHELSLPLGPEKYLFIPFLCLAS